MRERLFIIGVGGLFALAVTGAFAVDAHVTHRGHIDAAERMTSEGADLLSEHASLAFRSVDQTLKTMGSAHQDWVEDYFRASAQGNRMLAAIHVGSPVVSALAFTDAEGNRVAVSTDAATLPPSLADQPFFVAHRDSKSADIHISRPYRSAITARWVITVSRRLEDRMGEFAGTAVALLDLYYFIDLYERVGAARGSSIALFLGDGSFLARYPEPDRFIGKAFAGQGQLFSTRLAAAASGTYHSVSPFDGQAQIVSYQKMQSYQAVVAVVMKRAAVLAPWYARLRVTGGLAILAIVGACVATAIIWYKAGALRTEKEAAQDARFAADHANRGKSEFLAHMSHELRTPLNAILGFSQMMTREVFGPVGSPKYREYVNDIAQSGQHLLHVINNILDLAKVEAGKWEMEEEVFGLNALATDVARLLTERARGTGVALTVNPGTKDIIVRADPRLMRQILLNLAVNAIKFTERGGKVAIGWHVRGDGSAVLTVSDSGCGMTAEDLKRVFEPFGRASATLARKQHDTGLGLPLCKRFIEMHGGALIVESAPGVGTHISAVLPASRLVEAIPPPASAAAA